MPLKEYPTEVFYPRELEQQEIDNPVLVFNGFFDYMHLPQHREALRELLTVMVTGTFNQLSPDERKDIIHHYLWLLKIVEAAHLIHSSKKLSL
jgi:hypothetical protein